MYSPLNSTPRNLNLNVLNDTLYFRSYFDSDGTIDFIRSLGADPYALAKEVGLKFPPYDTKVQFSSWSAMCNLLELIAERYNEPSIGIKRAFTMPEDYRTSGPTVFLSTIASDMRHFINLAIEYQKIHTNAVSYSYEEDEDRNAVTGVISLHPYSPPCRQFCEHILAGIAIMGQRHVPNFTLRQVAFQHDKPKDISWHEKAFGCELVFNAERNTFTVNRDILSLKRHANLTKLVTPLLKTYLKFQVRKNPKTPTPISMLVVETLPSIIGVRNSDIQTIAATLNLHPKKLQRLLSDEGATYSAILDDVRRGIAERILTESNISIHHLAKMLDYSSDRPLSIAAKRWFGMPPSQYRQRSRQGDA